MTEVVQIQVPIPFPIKWVNCWYIVDSIPTLVDTGVNSDEALEAVGAAMSVHGGSIRHARLAPSSRLRPAPCMAHPPARSDTDVTAGSGCVQQWGGQI